MEGGSGWWVVGKKLNDNNCIDEMDRDESFTSIPSCASKCDVDM